MSGVSILDRERTDGWRGHVGVFEPYPPEQKQFLERELDAMWSEMPEFRELLAYGRQIHCTLFPRR